jgi:hypothetical protein
MRWAEIGLLWEGTLALLVIIGIYIQKKWYKVNVARFIVAVKAGLLALAGNSVVRSIISPQLFRVSYGSLTILGIYAIMMTYGAYAFWEASKKAPQLTSSETDTWND